MTIIQTYVNEYNAEFWNGLRNRRLRLKQCNSCAYIVPPANRRTAQPAGWLCPNCGSSDLVWSELSGRGVVETFVWYLDYLEPFAPEFEPFKLDLPYNVAVVRLAEGPRVITNVVQCGMDGLKVGMPVEAYYWDADGDTILRFSPSGPAK